jgi:hypothetical protein
MRPPEPHSAAGRRLRPADRLCPNSQQKFGPPSLRLSQSALSKVSAPSCPRPDTFAPGGNPVCTPDRTSQLSRRPASLRSATVADTSNASTAAHTAQNQTVRSIACCAPQETDQSNIHSTVITRSGIRTHLNPHASATAHPAVARRGSSNHSETNIGSSCTRASIAGHAHSTANKNNARFLPIRRCPPLLFTHSRLTRIP